MYAHTNIMMVNDRSIAYPPKPKSPFSEVSMNDKVGLTPSRYVADKPPTEPPVRVLKNRFWMGLKADKKVRKVMAVRKEKPKRSAEMARDINRAPLDSSCSRLRL